MTRVMELAIKGYRSIKDQIVVRFPANTPIVLVGENNAGKSNIVRALDLVLGESWPGTREPEDHDFWDRTPSNGPIEIHTDVSEFPATDRSGRTFQVRGFRWIYNQDALDEKCKFRALTATDERYVSNEMRDQCMCIVVGADRRLSYQLSYSSKWTLLSKLMRKFHAHLTQEEERVNRLKQKFEEVKQIFGEVSEFAGFQSELAKQFQEMFTGMTYGLQIDFSAYDPSNFFHSLRVLPEETGQVRTFEELGSGQEQLLALAFAYAYAKAFYGGIVLIIEEPEAHLHPLAQQWLARKIRQMAKDGLQVVLTTHSPAFVDLLDLEGIVVVRKVDNATTVKQLTAQELAEYCVQYGADSNRTNPHTVLPFYASSATQEVLSGLFAKKVILVEGQTEFLSLPIYLAKIGLDVSKMGIAVVPVMGKGNLAKWWRFFTAYDMPVFLTFDNDIEEDRDGRKRKDALETVGLDSAQIPNAIASTDWNLADLYCIFGKDFEETMRKSFSEYKQLEAEAKAVIGDSKPLVARYVADRLMFNDEEEGWIKLKELRRRIENLGLTSSADEELPF